MRVLVLLGPLCCLTLPAAADDLPRHIVFILADDVGCEPLGCYGGTSYGTPNIDRLAAEGLRFEHCYSMPVCHPSRVTLLTGRYPFRWGNPSWGTFPADAERGTIANRLRAAGFTTAVAGKWQLTLLKQNLDHPDRLGFDEYSLFGWHEGPRYHDPLIWQNGRRREKTTGQYGPDLYVEFLLDFLTRHQQQKTFLFHSMALCHDVTDDLDQPVPYGPDGRYLNYPEMVTSMDEMIGRLMTGLDRLGVREETLILFTGDNGTAQASIDRFENGRYIRNPVVSMFRGQRIPGGKGELTDGGTHVPLIANWPGTIAAGSTSSALVDFSDFLPTFIELGGAKPVEPIDGTSFAPTLFDPELPTRRWVYSEHKGHFWVRTERWKLDDRGRLHDLHDDPLEQNAIPVGDSSAETREARRFLANVMREQGMQKN